MKTFGVVLLLLAMPLRGSVTGLVLSSEGTPLANVRVEAFRPVPLMLTLVAYTSGKQPAPLASAVTDQKGTFVFEVSGHGLIDLHVAVEGFAPADLLTTLDEPQVTIALRRAELVSGQVTANGKAVANAFVLAIPARGLPLFATTDAQGRYHLPEPAMWAHTIVVRHPDLAMSAHPAGSLDFSLEPGQTIHGKVVDTTGRPVEGAAVDVDQSAFATSAADGSFTIIHAPRQASAIRARTASSIAIIPFTAGVPVLKFTPVAHLSGAVRDASKRPLSGVLVAASSTRGSEMTVTDAGGAFDLRVPRGSYGLVADAEPVYAIQEVAIDATQGDVKRDLIATKQSVTEGIVHDAEGQPLSGAAISLFYDRAGDQYGGFEVMPTGVVTAPDGRFRLHGDIESVAKVRLVALKPGRPPGTSEVVQSRSLAVITIPRGIVVRGIVASPDQKPLEGVRVDPITGMSQSGPASESLSPPWAVTDEEGRFHGELTASTKALTFGRKGYVGAQQVIEVAPGMEPLRVSLAKGTAIHGRVVNKDGSPAGDVSIATAQKVVMSSPDGSFTLEGLSAGPVELHFGRETTGSQTQLITAPADDIKLVLSATRSIHGQVRDATTGAPVEKFTINVVGTGEDSHIWKAFQSSDGAFLVEVPEGGVSIGVAAEGFAESKSVPVAAGSESVSIKLSRGRTLHGLVSDEKGQPLAGVAVSVDTLLRSSFERPVPQTISDGSFEIGGLPFDEETRVSFEKSGYVRIEKKLAAGKDDLAVNATLPHGMSLSGHVIDRAGSSAAGVSVTASSAAHGAMSASAQTDDSGAFQFDGLIPARYDFAAERQETAERGALKDIDVENVHELTIRLEPRQSATIFGRVSGFDSSISVPRSVIASTADGDSMSAPVDPAGNYRLEQAPVGVVTVQAISLGRATRSSAKMTLELQPGAEMRADLAFLPQVALHGRVTRGDAPLAGVTIHLSGIDDQTALTAPDGTYQLTADPGDYDVTLTAGRTALPFAQHVTVDHATEIDLRVEGATITATVLDSESGQPVGDASVTISPRGQTHTSGSGTTAADGTTSVEIPAGTAVTVVASKRGYANASDDVTASGNASVVLQLARTPGAVVRIVDARDGRTLTGYVIARGAAPGVVASADETDPDGTVTLPLAPGSYRISASAEGYGSHTIAASVPADEIRVPLPRGGSLSIKSNVEARGSARLIQPDGEEYVRCWCNGVAAIKLEGKMTLVDRISPGSYVLEVTLPDGKPKRFPVSVIEGRTATVLID